jgi:antitoxin component of RelBE/YafQ-DinJ toxin-antitoxin module
MKGIKRESTVHLRISEQEKNKYNRVANDIGLSLSAFARYSMSRTIVILNQVKKEL